MANTASAKKRIRQNVVRTARNKARMSRLRTFLKKVETAIESGAKPEAATAFQALTPEIMRAAHRGSLHRNAMARKLSRLSARIKGMQTA
jgi:small subunit ribosomal protein S20